MAETFHDAPGPGHAAMIATWANYAGAALSLALLIGVGVWGSKLVMREVSGVPVVVAADGPMRIAPDQPGGRPADHQGLSVNAVPGHGVAAAPADTLRLVPRTAALSDEDLAQTEIEAAAAAAEPEPELAPAPLPTLAELTGSLGDRPGDAASAIAAGRARPDLQDEGDSDVLPALLASLGVIDPAALGPAPANPAADPLPAAIPRSVPGVAVSRRPNVRPASLKRPAPSAAPPAPETREIAADSLADGTRLVQLGAFDSPETARSEWSQLDARFGDYLDDKARVIERAASGGRTFYRLRAHGFDDLSDARRFCAALVAEKVDCIPVVTR